MILEKLTYEKLGKNFETASQKAKIVCQCDYCGKQFERLKHNLIRSHQHITTDSCADTICVQKKRVEVNRALFGTDNVFQNEAIKTKIAEKNLDNLGVVNPMQSEKVREKHKASIKNLYGVENVFQSEEIKKKIKAHNQKHFNVDNIFQVPEIQEKQRDTLQKRYNKRFALQIPEFRQQAMETCIANNGCFPANHYGKTQKDIAEWLNGFGFNFKSSRSLVVGKEIDLYDENKKLAIEYCGLHWHHEHSAEPRKRSYHHNKYKTCLEQGVQLLTIFSDEWEKREKQCKGHIKAILGINDRRLFARKCEIKQVSKQEGCNFFNEYHIQGKNHLGWVFFGLFYEEELCGVMSLGKHHRQYDQVVLDRLCFKDGVQVTGGASRLFSACVTWARDLECTNIISFSDNRWSLGRVYESMKFELEREYPPDYSYVNVKRPNERISKQSQKKSTSKCPENMTEYEWAKVRDLSRIWDCGKKRWIFPLV